MAPSSFPRRVDIDDAFAKIFDAREIQVVGRLCNASLRELSNGAFCDEGREDLTPWLSGVFVGSHFRRQGRGPPLRKRTDGGCAA
jgi:hypothetical protein